MKTIPKSALVAVIGVSTALLIIAFFLFVLPHWRTNKATDDYVSQMAPDGTVLVVGKQELASFAKLTAQGDAYGQDANWRMAWDCYRQVAEPGYRKLWDWHYAASAALAAGETEASEALCRRVLEIFGGRNDPVAAERSARLCLVLPHMSGDLLDRAVELANFCVSIGPPDHWRYLTKGMAEYRLGQWSNALEWLQKPADSGALETSALGWGFIAMARHQAGDSANARKALDEVNRRFKVLEKTGGVIASANGSWENCARAVAVRAEAERLILGKEVSPPLNAATLANGRRNWQTFTKLADAARELAKKRMWYEASQAYAQAMAHPAFDWEVLELKNSSISREMALVFLQTGDETRHGSVVRVILNRNAEQMSAGQREKHAKTALINTDHLSPELKLRAVALARLACNTADAGTNSQLWFLRGLADYREGKYADALQAFSRANLKSSPANQATTKLFRAMCCQRLGRADEASKEVLQAASTYAGPGTSDWFQVAFYELALRELAEVMSTPGDLERRK